MVQALTPSELIARERAAALIRILHGLCSELVGDARFTLVLAVPVERDSQALVVETAGNASPLLTRAMLARAQLQHRMLRKNDPPEEPKVTLIGNLLDILATVCTTCDAPAGTPCDPAAHDGHGRKH
jgi:hypothetical protein